MRLIPPKYRRAVRIVKYAFLTAAGCTLFAADAAVLTSALGVMVYAWATLLFVGGSLCLMGVATDWWLGEFVGIPAIFFVFLMLALVLVVGGIAEANATRLTFGLIFTSFSAWVTARFIDIWNTAAGSKAVNSE